VILQQNIASYEGIYMIPKRQIRWLPMADSLSKIRFLERMVALLRAALPYACALASAPLINSPPLQSLVLLLTRPDLQSCLSPVHLHRKLLGVSPRLNSQQAVVVILPPKPATRGGKQPLNVVGSEV
jgi:hypothetical protein